RTDRLLATAAREVVLPQAVVQRQLVTRPAILRVQPEVGAHIRPPAAERTLGDPVRHAAAQPIADGRQVVFVLAEIAELVGAAELYGMRAGHVGERAAQRVDALVLDAIRLGRAIAHAGV